MSSPAVGVPSPAELLERIKMKLKNHEQVLWPTVSEKIQQLKAMKASKARENPSQEYRTVFHADLHRALMTGLVTDVAAAVKPEAGWTVTIKGMDSDGQELIVMVHCCLDDCRPLHITDFAIPQP